MTATKARLASELCVVAAKASPENLAEAKAKPCAGWLSKRLAYLAQQVQQ